MSRGKKFATNLQRRLADWAITMKGSQENKVDTRIETGGYHKPGSKPGDSGVRTVVAHSIMSKGKGGPSKVMERLRNLTRDKWGREYIFGR